MGKLGLVIAEGRSLAWSLIALSPMWRPTQFYPITCYSRISDLLRGAPSSMAREQIMQLTLDVSKAHRRILVHPDDRSLLCFHVGDDLYQCITLHFGARVSGWAWGRVPGLMIRTSHAILDHKHALWQYVDDLLAWLDKQSAPLWASCLVILFIILSIPMSWHKAALSANLTGSGGPSVWKHGRYRSHSRSLRSFCLNWILRRWTPNCWLKVGSLLRADFCGSPLHGNI